MIFGMEGQPRSGKSHEMVRVHLLENLRAGRKVYARLNGLDHQAIAQHLGESRERIDALLVTLSQDDVRRVCVCQTQANGDLVFPGLDQGALVIVDECHEFWPVGRAELPPPVADFFAKHGHWGLDLVLATQDFKEIHRSVVRRIQKKNYYTKLDGLGKENWFSVRYYTAPTAGKFEQLGLEKLEYDPAIWKLYKGVQPGVESNAAYMTGTKTLWASIKKPAIMVAAGVLLGVAALVRFFIAPEATITTVKAAPPPAAQPAQVKEISAPPPPVVPKPAPVVSAPAPTPTPAVTAPPVREDLPAAIRYLLDLKLKARPRYIGSIGKRHLVEFRAEGGQAQVLERLDSRQLAALGWSVTPTGYGLRIDYDGETIIFTPWPVDSLFQQSSLVAAAIRNGPPLVASAGAVVDGAGQVPAPPASPAVRAPTASEQVYSQIASYGDFRP